MHDLADYATLPFLAAFDIQSHQKNPQAPSAQKRVTYIALTKKTMPILVNLFLRFKENEEIYVDGTLESILSVCSFTGHLLGRRIIDGDTYRHTPIPIKLKYDCPSPSRFGKDLPLWKTATTCFLRIVKECTNQIHLLGEVIPDGRIDGIWRQILDVFRGGILADWSVVCCIISIPPKFQFIVQQQNLSR